MSWKKEGKIIYIKQLKKIIVSQSFGDEIAQSYTGKILSEAQLPQPSP